MSSEADPLTSLKTQGVCRDKKGVARLIGEDQAGINLKSTLYCTYTAIRNTM